MQEQREEKQEQRPITESSNNLKLETKNGHPTSGIKHQIPNSKTSDFGQV
ncbi:hypothetical protein [Allomuricauda sp. CP2A]|nr:hypothetical protein [Muricauda sp. CP2A]